LISAHSRHLRAQNCSKHTIEDRESVLRKLHRDLPFGLLYASTDELDDWLQSDPTWSAWTRATYAMHVRGFYRWATGRFLVEDPTVAMARPRPPKGVPRPVTDAELSAALERSGEPWRTAITLAAYAGLRVSEICGVYREHVTQDSIHLVRAKGGDPAVVPAHPAVWALLASRPSGPVAVRASGLPAYPRWITTRERRHFDSIELPRVTMHRFRHWFGTTMLNGGNTIRAVQEAMRHKSLTSTQIYTLVTDGQRRLAIRSLPIPPLPPAED
jgi:integrase